MEPTAARPGGNCGSGAGCMRILSDSLYVLLLVAAIVVTTLNVRNTFGSACSSEAISMKESSASLRAESSPQQLLPVSAGNTYDFDKPCSAEELETIESQLPGAECEEHKDRPYFFAGRCSFSYATRCPDPRWLHDYYREAAGGSGMGEDDPRRRRLAIYVGSDQGVDAVNTLKMLSLDERYDRRRWQAARRESRPEFSPGCKSAGESVFHIPPGAKASNATVYCLEPSQEMTDQLIQTRDALHYEAGLEIVNAIIASQTLEGGDVPRQTLDDFVARHVDPSLPVDILSLNLDGQDPEILAGADKTLDRVLYLDFAYNWKGAWSGQPFSEVIERLKAKDFVCFWSGADGNLWRITDCFLAHYDHHFWSHVACASRSRGAGELLRTMGRYYAKTLEAEGRIRYHADHTAATNGRGG